MFVRSVETLAGGERTGADIRVDAFDPVDVRQPVVRAPALTAAHSVPGDIATAVRQGAQAEIGHHPSGGFTDSGPAFKAICTRVKTVAIRFGR